MFKIKENYAQTDNRKERKNVATFKSAFYENGFEIEPLTSIFAK